MSSPGELLEVVRAAGYFTLPASSSTPGELWRARAVGTYGQAIVRLTAGGELELWLEGRRYAGGAVVIGRSLGRDAVRELLEVARAEVGRPSC